LLKLAISFLITLALPLSLLVLIPSAGWALESEFKGQLSGWINENYDQESWNNLIGVRYVPDITLASSWESEKQIDLNISANSYFIHNSFGYSSSKIKFYRLKARFTTPHSDTRIGLQKINFGPAQILRSLKWFDTLDPNDPLQMTDGVRALRYRYYFSNNANIWLWTLYGNKDAKGYESQVTKVNTPEWGGRFQYPVPRGELGIAIHTRKIESNETVNKTTNKTANEMSNDTMTKTSNQNKFALDGRWDIGIGVWSELVLIDQREDKATDNWKKMITLGGDYTFAVGSGLHIIVEHMINTIGTRISTFTQQTRAAALQLNYPINIDNQLSYMFTHRWNDKKAYHHLRWNHVYNNLTFNCGLFVNPDSEETDEDKGKALMSNLGKGIQLMVIYNH